MVNNIILSVNETYDYYGIMPIVYAAYRKFFPECTIYLGSLLNNSANKQLEKYCDHLVLFEPDKKIPTCNQGKMMRFYIAAKLGKETCMINDVDTIPLQRRFFEERYMKRKEGQLLAIGAELYRRTKNFGKFPISYMAAEGYVFERLFDIVDKTWIEFINSFKNVKRVDGKENLMNPLGQFSDESLIRVIKKDLPILHLKRVFIPAVDSIARRTRFLTNRLMQKKYFEAHHLHPISLYKDRLIAIAHYLEAKEPFFICR